MPAHSSNELYFISSNPGKVREMQAIIPGVRQLELDLDEIQSTDSRKVVEHKLELAAGLHDGEFFIDDTCVVFHCLDPLPGPLMKMFISGLGLEKCADITRKYNDYAATARTTIGYRDKLGVSHFFTGEVTGTIVPPRGSGFGWDAIFVPNGHDLTFGELGTAEKVKISMRTIAAKKLAAHLAR